MTIRYFALTPADVPTGVIRVTIGEKDLVMETFDARKGQWIDNPKAIDFLNGDDNDAQEVDEATANKIVSLLKA